MSDPASPSPVICADADEIYTMHVVDALGDTLSTQLSVIVLPRVFPRIARGGDTLTAQPAGMAYQWLLNGGAIGGEVRQTLVAKVSGSYAVAVTSPEGCPSQAPPLDVVVLSVAVTASIACPSKTLLAPGERVTIPVRLALPVAFSTSGINGAELWLHARSGVLSPASSSAIGSSTEGARQILRVPRDVVAGSTGDMVIPLDFIAMLGDTACTRIQLDSVTWRNGAMTVTRENDACDICVEICREGSDRLFDGTARASQLRNHPDPFNASTTIEFTVLEDGPYLLWLEDALGRRRLVLAEGNDGLGDHRVLLERGDLPSGLFFCVLRTQTWLARKKMIVLN